MPPKIKRPKSPQHSSLKSPYATPFIIRNIPTHDNQLPTTNFKLQTTTRNLHGNITPKMTHPTSNLSDPPHDPSNPNTIINTISNTNTITTLALYHPRILNPLTMFSLKHCCSKLRERIEIDEKENGDKKSEADIKELERREMEMEREAMEIREKERRGIERREVERERVQMEWEREVEEREREREALEREAEERRSCEGLDM